MTRVDQPRFLIRYGIAVLLLGIVLLVVLYLLRHVLLVLYVSTILAIGFSPAVNWLERRRHARRRQTRRMPRWAAILLLYVGGLGVIALMLAAIAPPVVRQTRELWTQLPDYVDLLQARLVGWGLIGDEWTWSQVLGSVRIPGVAVSGVLGAVQSVLGALGAILTVLLLPFYLLVEAETLQAGFLRLFPKDRRPMVARVTRDVTIKVGAWVGGQLLLAVIIGMSASVGLWFLGVPYFYVFGLIAAVGELVPVVGPILAAIPAVLVAGTVSGGTALFVAVFFAAQQFVENNILVPRIMKRQVGVSAVTVLVALLVGSALLGVVGALLAVPSAAIFQILLQEYLDEQDAARPDGRR
jgi:predicted PurR-regulated permease PerM